MSFEKPHLLVGIAIVMCNFIGNFSVQTAFPLTLTATEKMALDQFKIKILPYLHHDYMKQDFYLIRWLRFTELNQQKATQMLIENLEWRKTHKIDTILDEDWSDMEDDYDYTIDTFDKAGRPVGILNMGSWNIRKTVVTGRLPRLLRFMFKMLEEVTQEVITLQKSGQNVTQWKAIVNMDGFNLVQNACPLCISVYSTFLTSYQQRYPGFAEAIIIVNASPTFTIVRGIILPLLSPETRQALKIFGTDKKQWEEYFNKEIDADQRRPEFGGTLRN